MTWGIPTPLFLQIHVVLSLIGIATGLVMLAGMLTGRHLAAWAALFLATTVLTGVTGFPLPPFGLDPPRIIGILLLALLAAATAALYVFALSGWWRSVYVITALVSLYLNVFVAIVQSFQKIGPLNALAPTQSEPPFAVAQLVTLALFLALGIFAWRRFARGGAKPRASLA
ncbi:membrane protein [Bradyrhizobium sp. SSBR45G]|uniref:hypothetical protein n=1 Tax=unclassified Bradyrhizobium TaxID=2631580 RepID=UPI0023429AEE|nr:MULTISPECIES: hypothetical protein [unclassified Bradyrhizobium]GLH79563.1 membrane protein [Bradyrhizobium sp. SSBR45G]GLH87041.1 membrane protein [Bradyrhizobium sp. SSBR45R]